MAITQLDATKPGSSGWWLDRLGKELDARAYRPSGSLSLSASVVGTVRPSMAMYRDYYHGEHRLAFSTQKFKETFGELFSAYSENVCGVVVNSLVERLHVQGLRMPDAGDGDKEAWRIWQANGLDAAMPIGFREAAITGEVNILVGPSDSDDVPAITIEDPLETVVVVDKRRRVVALKSWYDVELGRWRAFVYWPDRIEKFWGPERDDIHAAQRPDVTAWRPQELDGEDQVLEHPLKVVPMVGMPHRPDLRGVGMSELAEVVPIQDAINKLVADLMVASEFGAFRQRWATGIEIPIDPVTGEPVSTFAAAVNRLWIGNPPENADPKTEARFGEFGQTDLKGYIEAIKQRLQMIATITRMPPHYLLGDPGQWPSGESLTAAETGLVAKAGDRERDYSDPIEEAFRLGFAVIGDTERAQVRNAEAIWRDARFRSESEHVDALVKMAALGIPQEVLWEKLPASPQEIARWRAINRAKALLDSLTPQRIEVARVAGEPLAGDQAEGSEAAVA